MQESKLTNFQQRQLEKSLRAGGSLPTSCNPTSSAKPRQPVQTGPKKLPKVLNPKNYRNRIRTKEDIEATGAYERPQYEPGPSHWGKNSEMEKEKLANFMAFGQDLPPPSEMKRKPRPKVEYVEEPEVDRFAELQSEIEERREFLADMEKVGQGEKFRSLIETQISQAIREMELIDKKRTKELEELIAREDAKKGR